MEPVHRFVADFAGVRERRCGLDPARRLAVQAGLAVLDLAGTWAGFAGAAVLHGLAPDHPTHALGLLVPPLAVIVAMLAGAYDRRVIGRPAVSAGKGTGALLHATIAVLALIFAVKLSEDVSRVATIGGFVLALCLVAMARIGMALAVRRVAGGAMERCLLIEDGRRGHGVAWARRLDAPAMAIAPDPDDPVMMSRIGEFARGMDRVIVACGPARRRDWARLLKSVDAQGEILDPGVDELGVIGAARAGTRGTLVIAAHPLPLHAQIAKRGFDIALALVAILLTLPLMLLVALAIRCEDGGPVLFRQQRMGQGNRPFAMLKFRSMGHAHCDAAAARLTCRGDARVTRVGRVIRATSIDELPQLFNVLAGTMSIVGPRPHAAMAKAGGKLYWQVDRRYWQRHVVKPGLTGLAQVRGHRGATDCEEQLQDRLQADLEYLNGWTIWRDLRIVAATTRVLVHPQAF